MWPGLRGIIVALLPVRCRIGLPWHAPPAPPWGALYGLRARRLAWPEGVTRARKERGGEIEMATTRCVLNLTTAWFSLLGNDVMGGGLGECSSGCSTRDAIGGTVLGRGVMGRGLFGARYVGKCLHLGQRRREHVVEVLRGRSRIAMLVRWSAAWSPVAGSARAAKGTTR